MEIAASPAAGHERAAIFPCDRAYLPYAAWAATSLAASCPDRRFDILVATAEDAALPQAARLAGVGLLRLAGDNPFAHRPLAARRSHASYLCLLLPELVADDYHRVLLLDCDVHITGGGWDALFGVDLQGAAIGAGRDNIQWRRPHRIADEQRRRGRPWAAYLNSGLLLADTDAWSAADLTARCIAAATDPANQPGYTRNDQSAINIALNGDWTEIAPHWNWQYTRSNRLFVDLARPQMTHFIGPVKPWNDRAGLLPPDARLLLRGFLAAAAPDHPALGQISARPVAAPGRPHGMIWRFLRHHDAIARHLARFPDLTTTHRHRAA